eukprot:2657980-Amphidinium_carterae.2
MAVQHAQAERMIVLWYTGNHYDWLRLKENCKVPDSFYNVSTQSNPASTKTPRSEVDMQELDDMLQMPPPVPCHGVPKTKSCAIMVPEFVDHGPGRKWTCKLCGASVTAPNDATLRHSGASMFATITCMNCGSLSRLENLCLAAQQEFERLQPLQVPTSMEKVKWQCQCPLRKVAIVDDGNPL